MGNPSLSPAVEFQRRAPEKGGRSNLFTFSIRGETPNERSARKMQVGGIAREHDKTIKRDGGSYLQASLQ